MAWRVSSTLSQKIPAGIDAAFLSAGGHHHHYIALSGAGGVPKAGGQSRTTQAGEVLIGAKVDLNRARPGGITPLMMAARTGKLRLVRALVAAGADVRSVAHDGAGALEFTARCCDDAAVLSLLIDLGL